MTIRTGVCQVTGKIVSIATGRVVSMRRYSLSPAVEVAVTVGALSAGRVIDRFRPVISPGLADTVTTAVTRLVGRIVSLNKRG